MFLNYILNGSVDFNLLKKNKVRIPLKKTIKRIMKQVTIKIGLP